MNSSSETISVLKKVNVEKTKSWIYVTLGAKTMFDVDAYWNKQSDNEKEHLKYQATKAYASGFDAATELAIEAEELSRANLN